MKKYNENLHTIETMVELALMKPNKIDYSLYLITDSALSKGRTTIEIVKAAVQGGATIVQLREKSCSTRIFIEEALTVKAFLKGLHIPLIINDRVDVAMAVQADGVHLGQDDMPIKTARKILKDTMLIGISTHSTKEAVEAEKKGADYIGVGPVFSTSTKRDTSPVIGPKGVFKIKKSVTIPIIGIGGIGEDNASEVISNGADGIAVISAIVAAKDPEDAAVRLKSIITELK